MKNIKKMLMAEMTALLVLTMAACGNHSRNESPETSSLTESADDLSPESSAADTGTDSESDSDVSQPVTGDTKSVDAGTKAMPSMKDTSPTAVANKGYSGLLTGNADYFCKASDTGGYIYYLTSSGKEVKIADGSSTNKAISGLGIDQIIPDGDWLYYVLYWGVAPNPQDDGLYRCRPDGSEKQRLSGKRYPFEIFPSENEFIFVNYKLDSSGSFAIGDKLSLYQMDKTGGNLREIAALPSGGYVTSAVSDGYAYVVVGSRLLRYSLSNGSCTTIHTWGNGSSSDSPAYSAAGRLFVQDGWICYFVTYKNSSGNNECRLNRMHTDGSGEMTLSANVDPGNCDISDNKLFFLKSNSLYYLPLNKLSAEQIVPSSLSGSSSAKTTGFTIKNAHIYLKYSLSPDTTTGMIRINSDFSNELKINS